MIAPLHVATVGHHPLRFFRTPLTDGRPDLPWCCVDDLGRCLGLNRQGRKIFLYALQADAKWRAIAQTVATADDILTIVPHFMAQGLIDAMIDTGRSRAGVRNEHISASAEALQKIDEPFEFPSDQYFAWMKAAMNRWE
jgi:hypothetical protein